MAKQRLAKAITLFFLVVGIVLPLVGCVSESNNPPQGTPTPTDSIPLNIENAVTISYTPPIIPVTFSIDTNGHITFSVGIKIVTPLGEIGVSATSSITTYPIPDKSLLLVIRHKIKHNQDNVLVDTSYQIDVRHTVGSADITGNIHEVKYIWGGKTNGLFIDASKGDITSIVLQGAPSTPTTTILTPTLTPSPSPKLTQEKLIGDFKKNTTCGSLKIYHGVTTKHAYKGIVTLTVSDTGQARGAEHSDAFYIYSDGNNKPISPIHNNAIGAILLIDDQPVENFIIGSIPHLNPKHIYTFKIKAPGGHLTFSVGDCYSKNNHGSYTITISLPIAN